MGAKVQGLPVRNQPHEGSGKSRALVSMDALVQQTESSFTARVLHFPSSGKVQNAAIETFDGTKDPINHLNTYKNKMELHGCQEPSSLVRRV